MGRASTQAVIFLMLMNAWAGIITVSGVGAALDINPEAGGQERIDRTVSAAEQIQAAQGITDTLFSLFVSMGNLFVDIASLVFYGPMMLSNLGVPLWLTLPIFGPATIIVAADVVHILTGRDP